MRQFRLLGFSGSGEEGAIVRQEHPVTVGTQHNDINDSTMKGGKTVPRRSLILTIAFASTCIALTILISDKIYLVCFPSFV